MFPMIIGGGSDRRSRRGSSDSGLSSRIIRWAALGLFLSILLQVASCSEPEPTESQCRPYIEKALKQQHIDEETAAAAADDDSPTNAGESMDQGGDNVPTDELSETTDDNDDGASRKGEYDEEDARHGEEEQRDEEADAEEGEAAGVTGSEEEGAEPEAANAGELEGEATEGEAGEGEAEETQPETAEVEEEDEGGQEETEDEAVEEEDGEGGAGDGEDAAEEAEEGVEEAEGQEQGVEEKAAEAEEGKEDGEVVGRIVREVKDALESEMESEPTEEEASDGEGEEKVEESVKEEQQQQEEEDTGKEKEEEKAEEGHEEEKEEAEGQGEEQEQEGKGEEVEVAGEEEGKSEGEEAEEKPEEAEEKGEDEDKAEAEERPEEAETEEEKENKEEGEEDGEKTSEEGELTPEEDLIKEVVIPENLRPRDHITKILKLDEDSVDTETVLQKAIDTTLKGLKGLYDSAIKPLEMMYKYRDLSNRHFGDPEIFSKPLVLFMGPWSGGKSSTINYLLDNEFTGMSLRTGAEPSPAYFNILMHGDEEEILDGTQLAADWTFSGLQKFGQSLLDRLKGYKLPSRLLEKVNIVEIPGILEIRKQVQRLFPFNDACQWFIDRADIIFLVYDPSKLDVGPETEAILDQLKGREYQTRIILNKADQVKPEELMRVQGTLIWNISPLMSSQEPPIMYSTSLWSLPYETGAPTRLLLAQERAFLRDLREAIEKRVENKIASARRFAVRVRNHAKMVDCYLTTYYNHKTFFGNRKKISDDIIENPQKYHIYEGLSTLTNISRYDLPDPDVYRDFFKINPLYDFTKLSDTCTYFRGCPINKLDVAIAYDLPELVGKYKKAIEAARHQQPSESTQKTNS